MKVISLGEMPPANAFLTKEMLKKEEKSFPLDVYFCNKCKFVQLLDIVSPELLFKNYVYVSSTSPSFVSHFESLAKEIIERFALPLGSLVVDMGSNDGILLNPFRKFGMRVFGVDPAEKIAAIATRNGIETLPEFFTEATAQKILNQHGRAKVITATSAFSHIDDLDEVLRGIKILIDDDGIFLVEVYYLGSLIEKNLFDTIYHEHLSYFTASTFQKLLERFGMEIIDVSITETHGGSLRVIAQKQGGPYEIGANVRKFLVRELEQKLGEKVVLLAFAERVETNKKKLISLLKKLKTERKRIAGYGAAAKGNTLLNYFGIGVNLLDYIVDDSAWKQGLYTPGTHIPVVGSDIIERDSPGYILILAWNFADAIMKKCLGFKKRGGKFIIPVPQPQIV